MQQKKETIKSDIRPGEVLWLIQIDEHGNLIFNRICTTGETKLTTLGLFTGERPVMKLTEYW